jgi:lambda family phage minor tail protein L
MTTPTSIQTEIQKLDPSAIIELFQLRLTLAVNGIDTTFYYHAGTNSLTTDVVFQGITYSAVPIEADGFELTSKGTLPRPTMRVANTGGAISALLLSYNPLQAKVTRIRTCKKFLDVVNFPGGVNPTADPTAKFEDQVWYIDRVSRENVQLVEFELVSRLDLTNLQLPGRQVQDYCPWVYRGPECGYTGSSYFDVNDNAVGVSTSDVCGKRFNSCRIRFQSQGISDYPHGGYPGSRIQI